MERTKTGRGFEIILFTDRHGAKCSIQESSLATENAIWFGVNDADPKILASDASKLGINTSETSGWISYTIPNEVILNTRMHLTQETVKNILPILIKFADTGKL